MNEALFIEEAKIVHMDDFIICGMDMALSNSLSQNTKLCTAFWKSFHHELKKRHMKQEAPWRKYALTIHRGDQLCYVCGVPPAGCYPDDFQLYHVPRGEYVKCLHRGPMQDLPQTLTYIWKTYLPTHQLLCLQSELVYYECYQEGFYYQQEHSVIELYIPLQSKPDGFYTIPAKAILQGGNSINTGYQKFTWFGMDFNMNLYKGCNHGCIYCDSRSSCYQVNDFDNVRGKTDELQLLELQLRKKRRRGTVGIGAMSDTYNPYERIHELTRGALQLLLRYGFGVGLDTKSDLILRDIDLLQQINAQYPSIIKMTITCADDALAKIIEPHVIPSSQRFQAIQKLHDAGLFVGILLMPILPFINDTDENILGIVRKAHEHHARFIYCYEGFGVTLRDNQRDYFYYMLDQYFPGKRKMYTDYFHNTYSCVSPRAKHLKKIFQEACQSYGILYRMSDIVKAYKSAIPDEQLQLKL